MAAPVDHAASLAVKFDLTVVCARIDSLATGPHHSRMMREFFGDASNWDILPVDAFDCSLGTGSITCIHAKSGPNPGPGHYAQGHHRPGRTLGSSEKQRWGNEDRADQRRFRSQAGWQGRADPFFFPEDRTFP